MNDREAAKPLAVTRAPIIGMDPANDHTAYWRETIDEFNARVGGQACIVVRVPVTRSAMDRAYGRPGRTR